jgi:hypothetical protein
MVAAPSCLFANDVSGEWLRRYVAEADHDHACNRIKKEMVAGRDDCERDKHWIKSAQRAQPLRARNDSERDANDCGIGDVQARDCCIRVVQSAHQALVEIDVATGHCVVKANRGDPWRCRWES